jgi:hypothetical protein
LAIPHFPFTFSSFFLFSAHSNSVVCTEYEPGQGISFHVDKTYLFGPNIVSVSLGTNAIMQFRKGTEVKGFSLRFFASISHFFLFLDQQTFFSKIARSVIHTNKKLLKELLTHFFFSFPVLLSGESRYQWQHSIPPRKSDKWNGRTMHRKRRVSLTFRVVIKQ